MPVDAKPAFDTQVVLPPTTSPVSTYDEWGRLEEVIVGTPYHLNYDDDRSFRIFFHLNRGTMNSSGDMRKLKPSNTMREEALEDLAELEQIFDDFGVVVRRPEVMESVERIASPNWQAMAGHALMSRDIFLVVGEEIIETSPMMRARYFESDGYKELFHEYFAAGARWTVAPKSRLLDRNFDTAYLREHGYREESTEDPFHEIMFDGAQVVRMGKDLLFNVSSENHVMGARWLQQHLGSDYRVHTTRITDTHIDGMLLPLRPGLLLARSTIDVELLPKPMQSWDIIRYDWLDEQFEVEQEGRPLLASQSIGMNVLSLDEEHVLVQDIQEPLMRDLERHGITPVSCRWRHGRSMGGGFHCVTLDIRRQGGLEDYFTS